MSEYPEASVRFSLHTGEFEVHGSEEFVAQFDELIQTLSDRLSSAELASAEPSLSGTSSASGASAPQGDLPVQEFGEALHRLKSPTGTEQILVAGKFAAAKTADGSFATRDASALLVEQGIKLSNPSQAMADNLKAKRVFKVGKNWRISRTGEEHLRSVLG